MPDDSSTDSVYITSSNATVTLSSDSLYDLVSLTIGAGDRLNIDAGGIGIEQGGYIGGNAGTIFVDSTLTISAQGGTTFSNSGLIEDGYDCDVDGHIINTGTIQIDQYQRFEFGPGAQKLVLSGQGNVAINGGLITVSAQLSEVADASNAFENVDNTITGFGQIGIGVIENDTKGVVNATDGTLTFQATSTLVNQGLVEATDLTGSAGSLVLLGAIDNTGGTIVAAEDAGIDIEQAVTGGTIKATNGSLVTTGTASTLTNVSLSASGAGTLVLQGTEVDCTINESQAGSGLSISGAVVGGEIESTGGSAITVHGVTLDGVSTTVTNAATLDATAYQVQGYDVANEISLRGTVNNSGSILLDDAADGADLIAATPSVTLQGGGSVVLGDGAGSGIGAASRKDVLHNVSDLITGNGDLGEGKLVLDNQSTVEATGGSPLYVALSTSVASTNSGTIEADGGGVLDFVSGTLANTGIIRAGTASAVYVERSFTLSGSGVTGGTLSGNIYEIDSNGVMSLVGGPITTDAATIRLDGPGGILESSDGAQVSTLDQSLTTIASGGTLEVGSRTFSTANTLSVAGTINLKSGTIASGLITGSGTSFIGGLGTIASSLTTAGSVAGGSNGPIVFTGTQDAFSGTFSGHVSFAAGYDVLGSGTSLGGVTTIDGATVKIGANLADSGIFALDSGTLALGVYQLTLSGSGAFNGQIKGAGGKLVTNGTEYVGALQITSGVLMRVNGTVIQNQAVTLGDTSAGTPQITIAGTWQIAGDVGIAAGSAAATINVGGGLLLKTAGGTTRSVVAPNIVNQSTTQGIVRVAAGKLELGGTLSGNIALKGNTGTTMLIDQAASAGVVAAFVQPGQTFQFNDAQAFKGSVTGFSAGEQMDLRSILDGSGYSPTLTYRGNGAGGTLTVSDGSRTASLAMAGSYVQGSFHLSSDAHGGSLITYG